MPHPIADMKFPLLLDGGLSNQLEAQGCDLNHRLWSAHLLAHHPEAIVQAHLAYLQAGAQCIITSSYQASIEGLLASGFKPNEAESLLKRSVTLAEKARDAFMQAHPAAARPWIAASIGPYGAYLADGSEYRGNYGLSDKELRDFHVKQLSILEDSGADFFACETIPDAQEAAILAEMLEKSNKQAWVSFSCKNDALLHDGTPFRDAVSLFIDHPSVFAVGVNCTHPQYIPGLIREIRATSWDRAIVVYPNSGEVYHAASKSWKGISDPQLFAEAAQGWLALGVDIIGGCCRIGPAHIEQLRTIIY